MYKRQAVGHGELGESLALDLLAGRSKLSHLADVGGLGGLAAGVGVHLSVEHEDVHVLTGGKHMVEAAVADIVGPAVAAHDPHGLLVEVGLLGEDLRRESAGSAVAELLAGGLQLLAVGLDVGVAAGAELVDGGDVLLEGGDVGLGSLAVGLAVVIGCLLYTSRCV